MPDAATLTHVVDRAGNVRELRFPRLTLERGPQRKTFDRETVRIGTADGADFKVVDPTVSAFHCELTLTPQGCRVVDLGSKNGVVFGGRRIADGFLQNGDTIALGSTSIRLLAGDEIETRTIGDRNQLGGLLGGSLPMRLLYDQIARVAKTDASLLITGETGTGKERVAEAVVSLGPRANGPFVVVDCASQGSELFESQLFGHVKGAFTGATSNAIGAFERANGGTVLLDQVCELPASMQPKLLGVLERKQVQPVGGEPKAIDVRVIATSRRALEREINQGNFRADLFYRLAAVQLHCVPLADRKEDVPMLVSHFCKELGLSKPLPAFVLEQIYAGDYPGNVRELRNAIARAMVGVMPARSQVKGLELEVDAPYFAQREQVLAGMEQRYVARLLEACDGNVSEAARKSGISRVQLYAMMNRYGLGNQRRK